MHNPGDAGSLEKAHCCIRDAASNKMCTVGETGSWQKAQHWKGGILQVARSRRGCLLAKVTLLAHGKRNIDEEACSWQEEHRWKGCFLSIYVLLARKRNIDGEAGS
jgi:hypothetical protein